MVLVCENLKGNDDESYNGQGNDAERDEGDKYGGAFEVMSDVNHGVGCWVGCGVVVSVTEGKSLPQAERC
jgi:hypothetical protein